MENLEKKSSEAKYTLKDSSEKYSSSPSYEGLKLLEEGNFKGKTSIKYWM